MNKKKELLNKCLLTAFLGILGIVMVFPIIWMVSASFKYESDVFKMPFELIPSRICMDNYQAAVTEFPFVQWYTNTFISTMCIVFLVLFISSLSGYAFAKLNFKGKNFVFMLFISTMMIPIQVRIIPQFMMFKSLGMINKLSSIIVPWAYNAFAIFLMRQFFTSIPDEIIEAARIDGASEYRTFFTIVMPLAKSQLMALLILAFTWGWNEYFGPLVYINDPLKQVLSVGIASFKGQYSANYAVQMAGATLALIPIIVVYLIAQKHFVKGIAMGAVKG